MTDDKSYIIDPLTSLCKLAILHFMPEGTKLGISHHVLYIQGYSYFQWLERMGNGDNRRDISNLNTSILKAIKWYILKNDEQAEMDNELEQSIRLISFYAIKGLNKLQTSTYNKDMTIKINLQYFINLLRDALDGTWNEENVIKTDNDNNILSDKIKKNYEANIINSVAKMLNDAGKIDNSQEDIDALVDCVHKLLNNRDNLFVKLMKDFNTTL
jgi:hypothetical protein